MLPNHCIETLMFPYSADVFYAEETQDAWGKMETTWQFNRTIKCQVVNVYEDSSNDRPMLQENQRRFQLWDESYVVRTLDNILNDGNVWYTPQQVILTNVRTSRNAEYWEHFASGVSTKYEISGIMPILDPFENLHHYKITVVASNDQEADGVYEA